MSDSPDWFACGVSHPTGLLQGCQEVGTPSPTLKAKPMFKHKFRGCISMRLLSSLALSQANFNKWVSLVMKAKLCCNVQNSDRIPQTAAFPSHASV